MERKHVRGVLTALAAILALGALTLAWHRYSPRRVPEGQPALAALDVEALRARFNEDVDHPRLIVLLSPT